MLLSSLRASPWSRPNAPLRCGQSTIIARPGGNISSKLEDDSKIKVADVHDLMQKFQKEAILRQMREYKREKGTVETQLNDLAKKAAFHDDHLRAVDAWLEQVRQRSLCDGFITKARGDSYWTKSRSRSAKLLNTRSTNPSLPLSFLPILRHSMPISGRVRGPS